MVLPRSRAALETELSAQCTIVMITRRDFLKYAGSVALLSSCNSKDRQYLMPTQVKKNTSKTIPPNTLETSKLDNFSRLSENREVLVDEVRVQEYNKGVERNNNILSRFAEIYTHGSDFYNYPPIELVRKIQITEQRLEGLAWGYMMKVPLLGFKPGISADSTDYQNRLYVDLHEFAHILDSSQGYPITADFKRISFHQSRNRKSDANQEDFITDYASTSPEEDLAETASIAIAFGDYFRGRLGKSRPLDTKYHIITRYFLSGKEWGRKDVMEIEQRI